MEQLTRIEEDTKTVVEVGEGLYAFIDSGIGVGVVTGDIAKEKADVLVNTVGPSLKLCEGVLSGQMLRAGGQELQTQCDMMCPDGVKEGQVIKTFGGRLSCKEVYHCCLPKWNGSNIQDLEDILFHCLNDAARSGHRSITFPALGIGHLKYPSGTVARLMVTGIKPLLQRFKSLETVTVVLNPDDTETITRFNAELQRRGEDSVLVKVTENEIGIGEMVMKIKQGDITLEDADCIVNSTDSKLKLTKGLLSMAIRKACGSDLQKQCKLRVDEMKKNGIAVTSAPNLKSKYIIHASFNHFHGNIKDIVKKCLKAAEHHGMTSVAFPALGTGAGLVPVDQMCKALISTLRNCQGQTSSIREIRVVIYEERKHLIFLDKLREIVDKIEKEKSWTRLMKTKSYRVYKKSLFRPTDDEMRGRSSSLSVKKAGQKADYRVLCKVDGKTEEAEVNVFSPSSANRKRAFEEIKKLCDHSIIEKTYLNMKLTTLSSSQIRQLKSFLKDMQLKIVLYQDEGKVQIEGLKDKVITFESYLGHLIDSLQT